MIESFIDQWPDVNEFPDSHSKKEGLYESVMSIIDLFSTNSQNKDNRVEFCIGWYTQDIPVILIL